MDAFERIRTSPGLMVILGIAILVGGYVLLQVSSILTPFILAAIFAYVLHPLVDWLEGKTALPRVLIILLLYVVFLGLLVLAGFLLVPAFASQVQAFFKFLPNVIEQAQQRLTNLPFLRFGEIAISTEMISQRLVAVTQALAERFGTQAVPIVLATFEVVIKFFVFAVSSFYFLLHGRQLIAPLRRLAPRRYQRTIHRILSQVNVTFGAYIRTQLLLLLIMTTASFIALTVLQVRYALALAFATGVLELVPFVGPWIAGATAVIVALAQGTAPFGWSSLELALVIAAIYFALRILEDQFVIPQLVGHFIRLHPVLVIFAVLAGASLAGFLGLLLAVPTLAALKIIVLAIVEELRHPPPREIVLVRHRDDVPLLREYLQQRPRRTLVLLVQPNALTWDDLPALSLLVEQSIETTSQLQVVTPDPLIASIATAAGIPSATRLPVPHRPDRVIMDLRQEMQSLSVPVVESTLVGEAGRT